VAQGAADRHREAVQRPGAGAVAGGRGLQVRAGPQSFHPDTIIIDLGLGRSESVQITANLRKNEAYAATLIVGLAGEDEADPDSLKGYGFNDVFKKPFDVALLAEKIRAIAEAKRED
jgi:DNA-binding response OmpR family regulator